MRLLRGQREALLKAKEEVLEKGGQNDCGIRTNVLVGLVEKRLLRSIQLDQGPYVDGYEITAEGLIAAEEIPEDD